MKKKLPVGLSDFKANDRETIEAAATAALVQIEQKKYEQELLERGVYS